MLGPKGAEHRTRHPPGELVFEGRNTYSFWSPLDREFLLAMVKLGHYKKYEFIDPFWATFFFAQLDYTNEQAYLTNASADANALILSQHENSALSVALAVGNITNTGLAYAEYIITNPPALKPTPSIFGNLNFAWTPVASKYLLESTNNLANHGWTGQVIPPRPVGGDYAANFKTMNGIAFFRLHLP